MHDLWVTQCIDIDQKVDLISRAGKCVNILYSGGVCLIRYDKPPKLLVYHSYSLLYLSVGWHIQRMEAISKKHAKVCVCLSFSFLFDDTRKIKAYLVDLDILAHSQCGPHSWDKHLHKFLQGQQDARYMRRKWNCLRILLMEETEGMEAGSHTLWESNCSLISQANIPEAQGQAK